MHLFRWRRANRSGCRRALDAARHFVPGAAGTGVSGLAVLEPLEERWLMSVVNWSGDITTDTTWDGDDIHRVTGIVRVLPGATLTIEPGAVVKFNGGITLDLRIEGELAAEGTVAQPIVFTSVSDDTGADGLLGTGDDNDTNGNGPSNGTKGAWDAIQFAVGSVGLLDHVEVRFGGLSTEGSVVVAGQATELTISDSTIRHSLRNGLLITDSSPTLTNVTFSNNSNESSRAAARMSAASNPVISGVTMVNNSVNAMYVDGGTIAGTSLWSGNMPYAPTGVVTVASGGALTVAPGTIVKFPSNGPQLNVEGTLTADGTAAQPIIFTALSDDTGLDGVLGNGDDQDANNNGSSNGTTGAWDAIRFLNGSTGALDNAQVRFGGQNTEGSIVVAGQSTTFNMSSGIVRNSLRNGVLITNANPVFTNVTFSGNSLDTNRAAARMDLASNPTFTGLTLTNNGVNGMHIESGTLAGDATWDDAEMPYRMFGDVTVPVGATLTIAAGQIIKSNLNENMIIVNGALIAAGTALNPIIYTGERDDTAGGDTTNNGAGTAFAGDAGGFRFNPGSTGTLEFVEVRYGGDPFNSNNASSSIFINGAGVEMRSVTVIDAGFRGIRIQNADPIIDGITIIDSDNAAMSMDLASNPTITDVTLANNLFNAMHIDGGTLAVNATWDDAEMPYRMQGDVTVPVGVMLTIGAGQIIKSSLNENVIIVEGALVALGTALKPIIYTSERDDSVGGDVTNDGAGTPIAGDAGGFRFNPGSTGVMKHVEVRYGGDPFNGGNASSAVFINGADVEVRSSVIRDSGFRGMRIQNADPLIIGTTFARNFIAAISMDLGSSPTISSPTLTNNGVNGVALDGGSIAADLTWNSPDIVYRVANGGVTVPTGRTLTIGAGQVIKSAPNVSAEFFIDGTLIADGDVDAPIYFTSERDDSIGGDTNNNGPSNGAFFDWQAIRFRSGSTGNILDHVDVRFAGANVPGAITAINATATITNSTIRGSASHGIVALSSANVTVKNSIIIDNTQSGIRAESSATVLAVNNTIDGNQTGAGANAATLTLTSNIITNSTSANIASAGGATVTMSFNDVFGANPALNYFGLASQTGLNGNIAADPLYFNRTNKQFTLRSGSAAVDAGSSQNALTTDRLGNPRFDDPNIVNTGGGAPAFHDIGAFERQEVSTSTVDLIATAVSGPAVGTQGMSATVNWTVTNFGTTTATGSWRDAIYLSNDPFFSADDQFLGDLARVGDLGPGLNYSASKNLMLSGILPGDHYFIVRTDSRNDIFEGLGEINNAAASAGTINFAMPSLAAGQTINASFSSADEADFYQLTVSAGETLKVALDSAAVSGATELYIRRGALPTRDTFDFRGDSALAPDQTLAVPLTLPGTYYVLAYSRFGATSTSAYSISAQLEGFGIGGASPSTGANAGEVTIALRGTQLTPGTIATLIAPGGAEVPAVATQFQDASLLYATFDLSGLALGLYDIQLESHGDEAIAPDAFTVNAGEAGRIATSITAPAFMRPGREAEVTVEYVNEGDTDAMAPLLVLKGINAELRWPGSDVYIGSSVELLGISTSGPAGVLPPGARGRITLVFRPTINEGDVDFQIVTRGAPGLAFDWQAEKASLRPAHIANDAWDAIFANFVAHVGGTVGEYNAMLADNATYLSRLGQYTADADRLAAFELSQAGNALVDPFLISTIDAYLSTPGLPLGFSRAYQQSIAGRFTLGALGRGWSHGWDVSAATDVNGNVTIHTGAGHRFFSLTPDGVFAAPAGDSGTLRIVAGFLELREADGNVSQFNSDGTLDFVEDTLGQRITAGYTAGRLTSLTHTNGDAITIGYNAQGRINQVSDPQGGTTTYAYDASGQHLTGVTGPAGTVTYTYVTGVGGAREHALTSVTGIDGTTLFYDYDAQGRLSGQRLAGDVQPRIAFTYDSAGGTTLTDEDGSITLFRNELGLVGQVSDDEGNSTFFHRDNAGNVTRSIFADGSTVEYVYDGLGNLLSQTDQLGSRVDMTYDPVYGLPTSVRDELGNTTYYSYDSEGKLTAVTSSDGLFEKLIYDALGNLAQTIGADGEAVHFTHDADGRLTAQIDPDGTQKQYTYNAGGRLVSVLDSLGTSTMAYDTAGRMTKITYPSGRFVEYTYNGDGQRTRMEDQSGAATTYEYDTRGRAFRLRDGNGALIVEYEFTEDGAVARRDLGNGTSTTYEYDALGRLTHMINRAGDDSITSRFDYTYDAANLDILVDTLDGQWTYGYDGLGRLGSVETPQGRMITYQYDRAGNRISAVDAAVTTNYATNNLNQYTQVGATSYTYDARGNMLTATDGSGARQFAYDADNRLISVSGPEGESSFQYDFMGHLYAVTRDGVRTEYLVEPSGKGNIVGEYDDGGSLVSGYTHGLGLVSRVDGGGDASYYEFDPQGNTVGLTNAAGAVVNAYEYLPFGEFTQAPTEGIANDFEFGGEFGVVAGDHGLHLMGARHYDAASGRFIQRDPIGHMGGSNLYTYAANDPTTYVDPDGLTPGLPAQYKPMENLLWAVLNKLEGDKLFSYYHVSRPYLVNPTAENLLDVMRNLENYAPKIVEDLKKTMKAGRAVVRAGAAAGAGVGAATVDGAAAAAKLGAQTVSPGAGNAISQVQRLKPRIGFNPRYIAPRLSSFPKPRIIARAAGVLGRAISPIAKIHAAWEAGQAVGTAIDSAVGYFDFTRRLRDRFFDTIANGLTPRGVRIGVVTSRDPNDILGPAGVGPDRHIIPEQDFPFTIRFENAEDADVAAQEVFVTQTLDSDFDFSTFEFASFNFGDTTVTLPTGLQSFDESVEYTDEDGDLFFVNVVGAFDAQSGEVSWIFRTLDPATGDLPADVFAGFLPPNDDSRRGEGFVSYFVRPDEGLATGTTLDAIASIVFDVNDPIITPEHSNTVDVGAPTSSVTALPATSDGVFLVEWSGSDDAGGSGIAFYDIFVSDNGGDFTLFKSQTTELSGQFTGENQHTYSFFSVATDLTGHVEDEPGSPDTSTIVQSFTRTIGAGGAKAIKYIDADGTLVTITLTTAGSAQVQFDGDNLAVTSSAAGDTVTGSNITAQNIVLTGTTNKSALNFTAIGGNKLATVGQITGAADLGAINAAAIDLTGNGIVMTGAAMINTLKLHDLLNGADILIPGTNLVAGTAITAGRFDDGSDLTLGSGVKSLTMTDWGAGTLTAPWVGAITTKPNATKTQLGDFRAAMNLSGTGAPKGVSLGNVKIAGSLGSGDAANPIEWDITGNATSITAGNTNGWLLDMHSNLGTLKLGRVTDADLDIDGDIGAVTAIEWLAGAINAESLKTLTISGAKTPSVVAGDFNAHLTLTGSDNPAILVDLATVKIAGGIGASTWSVTGKVGSITAGAVNGWSFDDATGLVSLKLGRVADAHVDIEGDAGTISSIEWLDGSLEAKSIKSLTTLGAKTPVTVAGDFGATLNVTGTSDPKITQNLAAAKVIGGLGAAWTVAGRIGSITAGAVNGWSLATATALTTLTLGRVAVADVTINGDVGAVTAIEWLAGSLAAKSVKTLTTKGAKTPAIVAGDFNAGVTLAGSADPKVTQTLGATKIAGQANAAWDIAGTAVGAFSAASTGASFGFSAPLAALTSLTTVANFAGTLAALRIGTMSIKGGMTNAALTLTQVVNPTINALGTLTVAGQMLNSVVRTAGNIATVTLGAMRQSTIFAGVDAGVTALPDAAADFTAAATVKTCTIKGILNDPGQAFAGSIVGASILGTFNLLTVATNNAGVPFGLAAQAFTSITFTVGVGKVTVKTQAELDALSLPMEDFDIRVPLP